MQNKIMLVKRESDKGEVTVPFKSSGMRMREYFIVVKKKPDVNFESKIQVNGDRKSRR